MLISFINDVDIQLTSEFQSSFGKNNPVFPKITVLGHAVYPMKKKIARAIKYIIGKIVISLYLININ